MPDNKIEKAIKKLKGPIKARLDWTKEVLGPKPEYTFPKYGFHVSAERRNPCVWDYPREMPRSGVQFLVLSDNEAAEMSKGGEKLSAGPALRLCTRWTRDRKGTPGVMLNVRNPEEAVSIGSKFRKCEKADDVESCAMDAIDNRKHSLAGVRSRRKSRR